ncbi:MAG: hypothetical protein ACTSRG_22645 [Candidatus Helarchaeota archaeon]
MSFKLILNLLIPILNNDPHPQKYSRAYLNLKNVMDLEREDEQIKGKKILSESIGKDFKDIEYLYKSFLGDVPLIILEKYYLQYKDELNKHVHLRYKDSELSEIQIVEVFEKFEEYFNKCFSVACKIADLYNIEVKLNENKAQEMKNNKNKYF